MSVFAEFHVPADAFALYETLQSVPETVVEIERVVATDELLTPYFWVSGSDLEAFETAASDDPSIQELTRLDTFEATALYRGEWTEDIESIVYAYTQVGAVIFEATGSESEWELRMRFDSRERLQQFDRYLEENEFRFELSRLHEVTNPRTGSQYGLTPKQQDALIAAFEAGYFESPRRTTLSEVADELDISQQALSNRLRRAHQALIANTLMVTEPGTDEPATRE